MIGGEALGCAHVWKRFGDVVANRDVSLSIARGEVHAVIGENGAGKSTLMRALYGLEPPDAGEVRIFGEAIARPSVEEAIRRRVGMVHQHFMLVPTLTVAENVVLGREPTRGPLLDLDGAARELEALSERYRLALEPRRLVSELSVGEAQRVEIVKVLWRGADVLILDEPTAVLTPAEVDELFAVLRGLVASGKTVVLVTHKLDEVLALAARVTVLRRGEVVAAMETRGATAAELARAMVGREVALGAERRAPAANAAAIAPSINDARNDARAGSPPIRLAAERLTVERAGGGTALDGVDLAVRGGEILGIAGVEGNGQTELALALTGVAPASGGRVLLDGADVTRRSVRERQRRGLGHVPEDRLERGLIGAFSVEDNLLLGRDDEYARPFTLDRARLRQDAAALIARLDVRPTDPTAPAAELSGGNQQKLVVGRELGRRPKLAALVCAQPTRGVDVGAIELIHAELAAVRDAGCAVLLISAELDELLALADRIAVLYRGRFAGEVANPAGDPAETRAERRAAIGRLMLGARAS
ncbi:MAG TPA: ABC transporter ATP-binding protein [Polyangia bacterium]|nr:ABC transporter ATP-binding protein [Polyangia bacterium]